MKKKYYIPTIEVICVSSCLMQEGFASSIGKANYGGLAPARPATQGDMKSY